jgi:hypothetical protein
VEGVLGPGAANNSTLGGSLVTTVAFGVPASVSTAILMGAFLIQGLVPGPAMLLPAPKGNLAVTFSMVWTIVISNVITVAICLLFLNQLAKIARVRGTLLIPFILTLVYVGAFAEKNVFEEMVVVLGFGALGWVMSQVGWPRPPLLLGLVLGPLAENKLFLSTDNYGLAWLARPGVLILLAIMLAGILVPVINARKRRRAAPAGGVTPSPSPGARFDRVTAFSVAMAVVAAWGLWEGRHFGPRAGLFPWAVGIPTLVLAIVQLARDFTGRRPAPPGLRGGAGARRAVGGGQAPHGDDVRVDRRLPRGDLAARLLARHARHVVLLSEGGPGRLGDDRGPQPLQLRVHLRNLRARPGRAVPARRAVRLARPGRVSAPAGSSAAVRGVCRAM